MECAHGSAALSALDTGSAAAVGLRAGVLSTGVWAYHRGTSIRRIIIVRQPVENGLFPLDGGLVAVMEVQVSIQVGQRHGFLAADWALDLVNWHILELRLLSNRHPFILPLWTPLS